MNPSDPPSRSGTSTPRAVNFTAQAASAEDVLKSQTVGLVQLADFRKRRADALELSVDSDANGGRSGTRTPVENDGASLPTSDTQSRSQPPLKKKKKVKKEKVLLSFGDEDEKDTAISKAASTTAPMPTTTTIPRKPNPTSTDPPPKALTKATRAAESLQRDRLKTQFFATQEIVKNTDIIIPFVFYDGSDNGGGKVKVKKGDAIWLILERARKVGAEIGVGSANSSGGVGVSGGMGGSKGREESKRAWARVGVDDLMLVRGEVVVPHHLEIYYFIVNKILDPSGKRGGSRLFRYKGVEETSDDKITDTNTTNSGSGGITNENNPTDPDNGGLQNPKKDQDQDQDLDLEGYHDDPTYTKVVDRRWYEKNKHIFPASTWRDFRVGEDLGGGSRRRGDGEGNAFFFS